MAMTKRYTTVNGQIMFAEQVSEPGKSIALVPDTLGNVIANKDVNGDMVRTCEYWPYGEIRTETDSNSTPFGYGGTWGYYSDPSGMLYVRARYYRPIEGRWLTVDLLWPGESAYGYVQNSPCLFIDRFGQAPCPPTADSFMCRIACKAWIPKLALDKNGKHEEGGVLCVHGTKCACFWKGRADILPVFVNCTLEHECEHFQDIPCPKEGVCRLRLDSIPLAKSECRAYQAEIRCIKKNCSKGSERECNTTIFALCLSAMTNCNIASKKLDRDTCDLCKKLAKEYGAVGLIKC